MSRRILIATDTGNGLTELISAIETTQETEVAGAIRDPSALSAASEKFQPSVVLFRLTGVHTPWLEAIKALRQNDNQIGFVVMSDQTKSDEIISMLMAGVHAIISIDAELTDLRTAVKEASQLKLFIPPRRVSGV